MLGATSALSLAGRLLALLLAVAGSGRVGLGLYAWRAANRLERPQYDVLRQLSDGVELRRYEPYVIAETEVACDTMKKGSSTGFRKVAGYIFGKNKPGAKMAMTAPVRTVPTSGSKMKISFVMESAYSKKSAPRPTDSSVKVKTEPAHVLAVRSFSGPPPNEERVSKERQRVIEALEAVGLRPSDDDALIFGYHDPFITPNMLRRNEVCLRVRDSAACVA